MNKFCHIGFSQIQELYNQHVEQIDSALQHCKETPCTSGMAGEPIPYQLRNDFAVTGIVFLCFFLAVYALKNGKKYLYQHIKSFFRHKERAGLFDDTSNFNIRYTLSLGGISCISAGLFVYDFFSKTDPFLFQIVSHYAILFIYIFCVLLTVTGKALLYQFINWIFFDKEKNKAWISAYFDLLSGISLVLFPLSLLVVYFNLDFHFSKTFVLTAVISFKILLFYKCIRNFFNHFHGILHLILYFCTLEIIPLLFLWKGLIYINNILILKF